jgi:hypothetical protein
VQIGAQVLHNLLFQRPIEFEVEELLAARLSLVREGIWPLALERFLESGGKLPPSAKSELMEAAAWPLRCLAELREIESACQASGIPILVFKGSALAFSTYPKPVQRSFGDIDLAVPRHYRSEFEAILEGLGFRLPADDTLAVRNQLILDLHDHPLNQMANLVGGIPERWWEVSEPLHVSTGQVLRLPHELEFVLSLFHGAKHAYSRANWIVDVAVQCQRESEKLAQTVKQFGAQHHLWMAQQCLREWYQLELPPALKAQAVAPGWMDFWSSALLRRVLERRAPDFLGMLTPLWLLPGIRAKLAYLWPVVFPPGRGLWERIGYFWSRLRER